MDPADAHGFHEASQVAHHGIHCVVVVPGVVGVALTELVDRKDTVAAGERQEIPVPTLQD